ncbi:MAG: pyridine nucleotide-disulfide oxidoreductase, partial [Rhodospirillaceae bacterium]|nr:pyridine nucleotide-disulfide oxidoreductase [Rhodospirillaceae bacterium]
MTNLKLAHGLSFSDLYQSAGLVRLDGAFLDFLKNSNGELAGRLVDARQNPDGLEAKPEADLLLELCPHVDGFIANLFGIEAAVDELKQSHLMLDPIYACKRLFVQRRALKGKTIEDAMAIDGEALGKEISKNIGGELTELAFADYVMGLLGDEETNKDKIAKAADYALWATYTIKGRARHAGDVLFNEPQKIDANNLVKTDTVEIAPGVEALNFAPQRLHYRDGFKLSDNGCNLTGALDE